MARSVDKLGGDENLLRELLPTLSLELKIPKEIIDKAYGEHDNTELRKELHKIRGGIVYLSLPWLDNALAEFHQAVKAEPQNNEQLYL